MIKIDARHRSPLDNGPVFVIVGYGLIFLAVVLAGLGFIPGVTRGETLVASGIDMLSVVAGYVSFRLA
jgi:hypothetical protein